jgi:hypothetical protein
MPPNQRAERGKRHQSPAQHAEPGRRHVQVHYLDGGALLIVIRSDHRLIDAEPKAITVAPASQGIARLASLKNRDGLARSVSAIGMVLVQNGS